MQQTAPLHLRTPGARPDTLPRRSRPAIGAWSGDHALTGKSPTEDQTPTGEDRWKSYGLLTLFCALLVIVALFIGVSHVHDTGTLWPDGPRYSNAAAMIHDWLLSGELLHPYPFAKRNYAQYPAFSIPYHPPVYPALLGLFFVLTDVSYLSARIFVALCLGGSACFFFAIQRRMQIDRVGCFLSSLLLITTPEIAHWARDTMSEVPGLVFILAGSYFFLQWLSTGRSRHCWAAFGLAEVAFLCRVTTAGLLPAWFLYGLLSKRSRRVFSWPVFLASALYLGLNVGYVHLAAQFGRFEVAANGRANGLSWENLRYFSECLPPLLLTGSAAVALAGLICAFALFRFPLSRLKKRSGVFSRKRIEENQRVEKSPDPFLAAAPLAGFWLCWLISYTLFKAIMPTSLETRHFFAALPALAGLAGLLFTSPALARVGRKGAFALCSLGVAANAFGMSQIPRGIVGYEDVAKQLASLEKPGNVLLACWEDQDLIFRYRAQQPVVHRVLFRSDRTLVVRGPCYAKMQARTIARCAEDVFDLLRRGRVRYLVTCLPEHPKQDIRYPEMILSHEVACAQKQSFVLLGTYPWELDFPNWRRAGRVFLWEFLDNPSNGPIELSTVIPTANLVLQPPPCDTTPRGLSGPGGSRHPIHGSWAGTDDACRNARGGRR
jgi:4-amino-4-deoxy-L-arabinose transferase-like glycosyltransferase